MEEFIVYCCALMLILAIGGGSTWFSLASSLPPFLPVRSEGSATPFHPMSSAPFGGPTAIANSFSDTQETPELNPEYQRIIAA